MVRVHAPLMAVIAMTVAIRAAENTPTFQWERNEDGSRYLNGTTRGVPFQKKGLIRLLTHPQGKEVYGLFQNVAEVKVLDPETLIEKAALPTPRYPVALWCDGKQLVVACDQARMILWISLETREVVRSTMLPRYPQLMPFEICGLSPFKSLMTLWWDPQSEAETHAPDAGAQPAGPKPAPVAALVEIGDHNVPGLAFHSGMALFRIIPQSGPSGLVQTKAFSWCQYTHGGRNLFCQSFVDYPTDWRAIGTRICLDESHLLDFKAGTPVQADFRLPWLFQNGGPVSTTQDGQCLIFPRSKQIGAILSGDWTYVVSQDLSKTEVEIPGLFIAEDAGADQYISWGRVKDWKKPEIFFHQRITGRLVRHLTIQGYRFNLTHGFISEFCPSRTTYVPGCDVIYDLCEPGKGSGMRYRCGPVDPSKVPEAGGAVKPGAVTGR